MIDDSILSMVAIGLTLLFLGLVNGFQFAATQLPPDSLPQLNLPRTTPGSTTGDVTPLIKPGTIITGALAPLNAWVATLGHEHPLIGRIWAADRQEGVLPAKLSAALVEDLKVSHCNQLQDADVAKMTEVQRFRDAVLADNVLKAVQKSGGAVLIAGDGHVRSDRGVPYYLHARAPGLKVVSILLKEVETGVENPADAVPRDPDGKPAANFVWFTARSDRVDQCDALRQQLQQKRGTG